MTPGSVLYHRDFTFDDGGKANKLLVVVSETIDGELLILKTTSQQKHRTLKDGCHFEEGTFTFNANSGGFNTTTWVILEPIIIESRVLLQRHFNGEVRHLFDLQDVDCRAVINCLKRSEDVAPEHLRFLP